MNRRFCRVIYLSTHWQCLVIFEANRILPLKQSIFNATNQWTKSTRFFCGRYDSTLPVSTCRRCRGKNGKSDTDRPPRSTQRTAIHLFLTGSTFQKSPHMRARPFLPNADRGRVSRKPPIVFSITAVKCLASVQSYQFMSCKYGETIVTRNFLRFEHFFCNFIFLNSMLLLFELGMYIICLRSQN